MKTPFAIIIRVCSKRTRAIIIAFFFIFFLSTCLQSEATTIAIFRTNDDIFIGADSSNGVDSSKCCKIIQVNNVFFSMCGHIAGHVKNINFNAIEIAKNTFKKRGTIESKINIYNRVLKRRIEIYINAMRKENKESFMKTYNTEDRTAVSTVIAIDAKPSPIFYVTTHYVVSCVAQPVKVEYMYDPNLHKTRLETNRSDVVFVGYHDTIAKSFKENGLPFISNPVKMINDWITLETIAHPDRVSLPINILRISHRHAEWIQHKQPECQEIDEKSFNNNSELPSMKR